MIANGMITMKTCSIYEVLFIEYGDEDAVHVPVALRGC